MEDQDATLQQGRTVSFLPEEEEAAETVWQIDHSRFPCPSGEEVGKSGVELSPGRGEGCEEGVFKDLVVFLTVLL